MINVSVLDQKKKKNLVRKCKKMISGKGNFGTISGKFIDLFLKINWQPLNVRAGRNFFLPLGPQRCIFVRLRHHLFWLLLQHGLTD